MTQNHFGWKKMTESFWLEEILKIESINLTLALHKSSGSSPLLFRNMKPNSMLNVDFWNNLKPSPSSVSTLQGELVQKWALRPIS